MSQSLPDATSDDSLAVEEFLLATEGSHDLNLGLDQISIADTIAPTENIFAKIGKGANARGVFPAHKLAMEDIYPDADLKLQDEDGVQVHSDESHVAPAVYLMDIFVSLPPSVWRGTTSNSYIPSKANLVASSTGSKSSKKKNKKHLAVTRKTAFNGAAENRVIKLPPTISNKDTFLIVRQTLSELQETSHITCFHLEITVGADILETDGDSKVEGNVVVICQDFMEIGSLIPPHSTSCTLTLVPELYDIKKIRYHIKKVRDTILFPPLSKAISPVANNTQEAEKTVKAAEPLTTDNQVDLPVVDDTTEEVDKEKESGNNKGNKNKDLKSKPKGAAQIPSVESVYQKVDIADFFSEVLFRTGKPDVNSASPLLSSPSLATPPSVSASTSAMDLNALLQPQTAPALFSCIKSITLSGWNPPPPYRKVQGDLLYLEVITGSEGVFHITAVSSGFYVNRNNRHHFDPTPSTPLHFHHSLWDVLLEVSGSFRSAWAQLCCRVSTSGASNSTSAAEGIDTSNPMDTIATFYSQGRGDLLMLKPQWIAYTPAPSAPSLAAVNSQPYVSLQTYDIYRAQEDLCDMYGVDELGATRDWNDEIQTVRFMPTKDVHEKIISARYEFKVLAEFTDACKAAAIAISSGLINPISDLEPQPIAVSDSANSSLSFPSAATSNANQAHIFSYNGIFYSKAMDNKDSFRLCVGDEAYRKLASRDLQNQNILRSLNIPGLCTVPFTLIDYKGERIIGQGMIPGILAPQGDNFASLLYGVLERGKNLTVKNSSLLLLQTALKQLHIPTRTILKNPFPEEIATLASESEDGAATTPSKAQTSAQEEMPTSIRIDTNDDVVMSDTVNGVDPATVVSHVGPIELKLLKGSDGRMYCLEVMRLTPRDANYVKGEKGSGKLSKEWLDKTDDNLGIACVLRRELVVLYIENLVHSKRQELILDFNKVLLEKTAKAEEKGEGSDSKESISKESEEKEDTKMETEYLTRIKAVSAETLGIEINPNCFLQFDSDVDPAVIAKDEETARKMAVFLWDVVLPHLVNQVREGGIAPKDSEEMVKLLHSMGVNLRYLGHLCKVAKQQEDSDDAILKLKMMKVHSMPRFWLELLLIEVLARAVKHHLNALYRSHPTVITAPALTIVSVLNHLFSAIYHSENSATNGEASNGTTEPTLATDQESSIPADEFVAQLLYPNAALSQDKCLQSIQDIIASRFCLQVFLSGAEKNQDETESVCNISFSSVFLGKRLSQTVLLRRICQLNGIQIAMRHYDFNSSKGRSGVFHVKDIVSLVPVVKSCQPDELVPEIGNLLTSSGAMLQQPGGIQLAFELMQQASQIATQIAGPLHKQTADVSEQIGNLLISAGDIQAAVQVTVNNLATANQLYGLDSAQSCTHHVQLATLYSQLKNIPTAVNHLLSARYIIASTAGSNHPAMADIFIRLGSLFHDLGDYDKAFKFFTVAKRLSTSMVTVAHIGEQVAMALFKLGMTDAAIEEQKRAYTILRELIPDPKDSRIVSARSLLEKLFRSTIEEKKKLSQQQATEQATATPSTTAAGAATPVVASAASNASALEEEADGELGDKKKPKKKSKAKK